MVVATGQTGLVRVRNATENLGISVGSFEGLTPMEFDMKLITTGASPYARQVMVCAAERGLADRIQLVHVNPHKRPADLVATNPLSKVPTLVADDGTAYPDSLAICMYLETLGTEPALIPRDPPESLSVMRTYVLARGVMDVMVERRVESIRPEHADQARALERDRQTGTRVMDSFEKAVTTFGDRIALDTIAVACALSYVGFRFPEDAWQETRPQLSRWHEAFAKRDSMLASEYFE